MVGLSRCSRPVTITSTVYRISFPTLPKIAIASRVGNVYDVSGRKTGPNQRDAPIAWARGVRVGRLCVWMPNQSVEHSGAPELNGAPTSLAGFWVFGCWNHRIQQTNPARPHATRPTLASASCVSLPPALLRASRSPAASRCWGEPSDARACNFFLRKMPPHV